MKYALLTLIVLGAISGVAHAQWDAETPIINTGGDVWGEGIATSGSSVYLIYGTGSVKFRSSSNQARRGRASRRSTAVRSTSPIRWWPMVRTSGSSR